MNQKFGFLKKLVPKVFVTKFLTSRKATKHRRKCKIGSLMYCYQDDRTKNSKKFGTGLVIGRGFFKVNDLPSIDDYPKKFHEMEYTFIFPSLTWLEFLKMEGFDDHEKFIDNYKDFYDWFDKQDFPEFITFWFKEYKGLKKYMK